MIVAIINGYFRSGTTFIWKSLNAQSEVMTLYEPLHPRLDRYLAHSRLYASPDPLHGARLWSDYHQLLDEPAFAEIRGLCSRYAYLDVSLAMRVLQLYDSLETPVILQTNRLQILLSEHCEPLRWPFVHIVRNPIDVVASLMSVYRAGHYRKRLRRMLHAIVRGNSPRIGIFQIDKILQLLLSRRSNLPVQLTSAGLRRLGRNPDRFHLLGWLVSNLAIMEYSRYDESNLIVYERLSDDAYRVGVESLLSRFGGADVRLSDFRSSEGSQPMVKYRHPTIMGEAERHGLSANYARMLQAVEATDVSRTEATRD